MGELGFAKQFLTTLDNKSTKYQADQIFDPKTFPTRTPYTLPKLPHPPHPLPPRTTPAAPPPPGSEAAHRTVSVTLKSSRNPALSLTIPAVDTGSTTIQSIKEQVQSHLGGPSVVGIDKIKILLGKKPVPASKKTVSEALESHAGARDVDVEFGVMVIGGAPDPLPAAVAAAEANAVAASAPESEKAGLEAAANVTPMAGVEKTNSSVQSAKSILETSGFWDDLQGFLEQRIRDQNEAAKVRKMFELTWRASSSAES